MNLTKPVHTQFIQKPVYAALSMLSYLAEHSSDHVKVSGNLSYVITFDRHPSFYSCIIMTQSNDTSNFNQERSNIFARIDLKDEQPKSESRTKSRLIYIAESLESNFDPVSLWKFYGKPSYPTEKQFSEIRSTQYPRIVIPPTPINDEHEFVFNMSLRNPWILMIRICSENNNSNFQLTKVENLRIRHIHHNEVVLFWNLFNEVYSR